MADKIITQRLCDFCQADDIERDGERRALRLDADAYEVDVCKSHAKPLDDLAETLATLARKVPARVPRPAISKGEPETCPACQLVLSNVRSLAAHTRVVHGVTLAELEGKPVPFVCDTCGKRFSRNNGLIMHQRAHANADKPQPLPRVPRQP